MCGREQRKYRWETEPAVVAPNTGGSRLAAGARDACGEREGVVSAGLSIMPTLIVDSNRSGNGAAIASEAMRSGGGTRGERWACSRYSIVYFMDRRG